MEELLKQIMSELKGFKKEVNDRFDGLEEGQERLENALKHNMTLMTENFTNIRKDIRIKIQDTQSDVDLLFKEVEGLKRKTNKIEQKLT
ncbi:hypothetical protein AB4Y30_10730 [Ornithinibacillus sp. 4-3]|uniref:Uncharacterized protein n=1 Tax=Ornithinibacillus sp. 4-3 TaxID=3231488 RepID=A0AB39HHZ0_9BACI